MRARSKGPSSLGRLLLLGVGVALSALVSVRVAASDPLDEKLRHCPASVDGARVEIRDIPEGVAVAVTATSATAASEIRRRVAHLEEFTAKGGQGTGVPHGGGQGGGWMRDCPIVTKDTRVLGAQIPGGVLIRVESKGKDAKRVSGLRAETRARWGASAAERRFAPDQ